MLAIRMQRTGRSGHAQFRLIVQDSRFSPTSGRVVAFIGSYNPHSKAVILDKEKTAQYLANGAQPSPKLIKILKSEGVKLPEWVTEPAAKKRATKKPEKLRKNRPAEEPKAKAETSPVETAEASEAVAPAEETVPAEAANGAETPAQEQPADEAAEVKAPDEKVVAEKEAEEEPVDPKKKPTA